MPERRVEIGIRSIGRFINRELLMVPIRVGRRAKAYSGSNTVGIEIATITAGLPLLVGLWVASDISSLLIATAGATAAELALIKITGADMPITPPIS